LGWCTSHGSRRVVVTGIGLLSPAGNSLEAYWKGITNRRSAIRNVQLFDTSDMSVHSGGEVDQGELERAVSARERQKTDRAILLGMIAAGRALADAGVDEALRERVPVGVLIGSGLGPCHDAEKAYGTFTTRDWKAVRPTFIPRLMFNRIASQISIKYGLTGGHHVVAAACASGTLAMIEAFEAVRSARETIVLTGGCDSPMIRSIYGPWVNLRILSKNPEPSRASRPFDKDRDGLVLAEGAAMLVFEDAEHAIARGATCYAEVAGGGTSSDASHITNPNAEGQALAIQRALEGVSIGPEDIDYINAHGTSTMLNDVTETRAIKLALGESAYRIPISSTKSVIGHCMGASGALELVATILALQNQILPPTLNLDEPDPECDLDYVPNVPRPARIRTALSNSFAFGGANGVIVVRYANNEYPKPVNHRMQTLAKAAPPQS